MIHILFIFQKTEKKIIKHKLGLDHQTKKNEKEKIYSKFNIEDRRKKNVLS